MGSLKNVAIRKLVRSILSFRSSRLGLAEVWTHTHDNLKFAQYGWRCTTNENSYSDQTLVGNWNQQRFDTDRVLRRQKIPNKDAIDTWNTTYREGYNRKDILQENQSSLELMKKYKDEKNAFPHHQPETDPASFKHHYNSWSTTQRAGYGTPPKKELF